MDCSALKPGDKYYKAYVGPPEKYGFMGATQFRLLTTLGLRDEDKLLDFGCGSLRAGRLFIPYLNKECYFGIEPNKWLVDDAISHQIGEDLCRIKKPQFSHRDDCDTLIFKQKFDYILAQSIFSHTGKSLLLTMLSSFQKSLAENGIIAATFVEGSDYEGAEDWIYPDCVTYCEETIVKISTQIGFFVKKIPWFHPSQVWYLFALKKERLPTDEMLSFLSGAVLHDQNLIDSWMTVTSIEVTHDNFREKEYLQTNKDISQAVAAGNFLSGRAHFEQYGYKEGRKMNIVSIKTYSKK